MIKSPHPLLDALIFWAVVIAIALLWTSVSAQDDITSQVYNCGNPDGLIVQPSGRVIEQGEIFIQIGDEIVNYETGVSSVNVYDGTISREDLFICEVLR
jgi:hypothetical protein